VLQIDEQAYRMTEAIERSIVRLNLDCQGEFVALINAMQMQLDSGRPVGWVIRLLADAFLVLAEARGVRDPKLRLGERFDTLVNRVHYLARRLDGR
jgi:hypothetical protein